MKKLLIAITMCLPLTTMAQNDWEVPDEPVKKVEEVVVNPDQKYLAGAVPVIDGKVTFEQTFLAPGMSANEIYDKMLNYIERMTKGGNQFEESRVLIQDKEKHQIVANFLEWLVFTDKALVLDRTRMRFPLFVDCKNGEAKVRMTRISYLYEEERDPQKFTAEEWITDEMALNKKQTKLARTYGKFRRKTIDRKDFIFSKFEELLK